MLLQMVNMADVARGMGPQVARSGKGGGPSLQVRQPAPQVELTSGVAKTGVAKTGRDGGNVRGDAVSDRRGSGAWLEQRAELIKLAQPLLDQRVPVSQVHEALQQFVERKRWGFLSPATLEEIVEAAIDALVDAEMEEEAAQRAANLVPQADELHEVSLADITPEPVRWLWPGKIPLNKVTVIYGEAGIGKTCLALDLAARVSAGTDFLDGTSRPEAGQVLIVNGEDSLVDGISPRLVGGGAKLQNISVIAGMKASSPPSSELRSPQGSPLAGTGDRRFDLGRDLPVLRKRIAASGQIRLVIIDPLEAYCGKGGASRARLRDVMAELTRLAAETGVAVVVISSSTKCDLPVKNVWRVDCDVLDAGVRYWVPVRFNYGPLPAGLAFRVTAAGIEGEARSQGPTADRGRGASAKQERCVQLQEHAEWLRQYLAAGSSSAGEVFRSAAAAGLSVSQLKRAKQALGIRCHKEPVPNGRWIWDDCGGRVNCEG